MRLAPVFQRFGPRFGVPALAVTFPRGPKGFQASWSHPSEKASEFRSVVSSDRGPFCAFDKRHHRPVDRCHATSCGRRLILGLGFGRLPRRRWLSPTLLLEAARGLL